MDIVIFTKKKKDQRMIITKTGNTYMIQRDGKRFGASSSPKSLGVPNVCALTSTSQPQMSITLIHTAAILGSSLKVRSSHFANPAIPRKQLRKLMGGRVKSQGVGSQQACWGDDFSVYGLER